MIFFSAIGKLFKFIFLGLDGLRKALHLVFLLFFALILVALFSRDIRVIPESSALRLAPSGTIVEQLEGNAVDRAFEEMFGEAEPQTLLRDLIESLDRATDDPRITSVVLRLDQMSGVGLSHLQSIGAAIDRFKSSGKPVIAVGDFFGQGQYYLAAHADEVFMHRMGAVYIDGFGSYRIFMKDALDKLRVDMHVFRAGDYKSYGDPYDRMDMSDEEKEETSEWLGDLWQAYQDDVTAARDLDADALRLYVEGFVPGLEEENGNLAALAINAGLVDELLSYDEMVDRIAEVAGRNGDDRGYQHIEYEDYIDTLRAEEAFSSDGPDKIGVIVAEGDILNGSQAPGRIGSDSLASLIREAAEDDGIKAVVLRVNSPGGSTFASDVIYQELRALREVGKPLVVSMANVAASGGYWIALPANEIWASPTTVTGSIGVVALFPSVEGTLDYLGLNVDGVGTTPLSGEFDPSRGLGPQAEAIISLSVAHSYQDFLAKVSTNRGMTIEQADEVAQGRVWSGTDAYNLGLVDELGGLEDALDAAARLAGLEEYWIHYIERELSFEEALALRFYGVAGAVLPEHKSRHNWSAPVRRLANQVRRNFEDLALFNDPGGLYYYCFCQSQ